MDSSWTDPQCDWWAKVEHAGRHIERVREAEVAYLSESPWELEREATNQEYLVNLRIRLLKPPPVLVALHAGDALHNMSSALDAIAYALARRTYGPALDSNDILQTKTAFPVKHSRTSLQRWAQEKSRSELFSQGDIEALWRGQSYYWAATAWTEHQVGPEPDSSEELAARSRDSLKWLRHLHNVDKHRRLHVTLLGPDLPSWGAQGESQRRLRIDGTWRDGQVIAQVFDPPSAARDTDIDWDLRLVLFEQGRRPILVDELVRLREVVRQSLFSVIHSTGPRS